jgi:hypothetical protein
MVDQQVILRSALTQGINMRMFYKDKYSGLSRTGGGIAFLKAGLSVDYLSENILLKIPGFFVAFYSNILI